MSITNFMVKRFGMFQTFRARILTGYGGALLIIAAVFSWSAFSLLFLGKASESILRENYKSILAAENMIGALERQDSAILSVLLGFGDDVFEEFRENENRFFQWLGRAMDNITIEGEREILEEIQRNYTAFLVKTSELFRSATSDKPPLDFYRSDIQKLFRSIRATCIRLREINENTMFVASKRAQRLARRSVLSTVVLGIAAILLGLFVSLFLSNRLARPIEQMREATLEIGRENYDIRVPVHGSDELGILAGQFNGMAEKLKEYHDLKLGRILEEKNKNEAILHSVDDGIVVVNSELKVTNINPMAARIFEVETGAAIGRHFLEIHKEDDLFQLLKLCLESGHSPSLEEGKDVISVRKGNKEGYFQFSVIPIRGKAGPMPGVVLVLRDITRLRMLDRLKSEFVMTVSHELRTPLTSIGMSIELLKEKAEERLNDKERELLAAADEDIRRLKALVNELLDLSKIEAGHLELALESVSARRICEDALSLMQTQAEQKGIEVALELSEALPEVRADVNKATWVVVNLLGNALRFTDTGGHVLVSARKAGRFVHFSVRDDGEGIPYEYHNRIFDKFVQVKSDRTAGGSGLGLAICKEIIRAHGGTIWVESLPGKGSIFTFTLPVSDG